MKLPLTKPLSRFLPAFPGAIQLACLLMLATASRTPAQISDNRQLAALRADLQVLEESNRKLVAAIETLSRDNAALQSKLAALDASQQAANARLGELSKALQEERNERLKMGDQILSTITGEIKRLAGSQRPAASAQGEYTVVRGDTLSAIASAFGVSVHSLKAANNLQSDIIREGQSLIIPAR